MTNEFQFTIPKITNHRRLCVIMGTWNLSFIGNLLFGSLDFLFTDNTASAIFSHHRPQKGLGV
jgi:hypothetical protein